MMAMRLCVALLLPLSQADTSVTSNASTTAGVPAVRISPASCFVDIRTNQFAPTQANVKRIICPYLSSMINEGILPMKKFYTRSELFEATKAAGSNPQGGQAPFDPTGHVAANFQFNAPGLIDIFNMEGNPNEHDLSTGINDCETIYPCFDEAGRGKCTHAPTTIGRLNPLPIPVPNPTPTSPTATAEPEGGGRLPAFINFCPNILDHLPKCFQQNELCNCTIPNAAKAEEFWKTLDTNNDGLATLDDLDAIRANFAMPGFPPLSEDKNPVGSVALAGSFDLLNQIFATTQADISGTPKPGLNRDEFIALNVERRFPTTYTFPGGCFVDPNEKVNQNDYSSVSTMQSAGWTVATAGTIPDICKDAQNGISELTGTVFYGASAKVTVRGSGVGYVDFGNCAAAGVATLKVGGLELANTYQEVVSKVVTFPYTDGQVVEVLSTAGAVARVNFVAFNGTLVSSTGAPCPIASIANPCEVPSTTPSNPCSVVKYDASNTHGTVDQSFQMPLMFLLVLTFVGSVVVYSARHRSVRNSNEAFLSLPHVEDGMTRGNDVSEE